MPRVAVISTRRDVSFTLCENPGQLLCVLSTVLSYDETEVGVDHRCTQKQMREGWACAAIARPAIHSHWSYAYRRSQSVRADALGYAASCSRARAIIHTHTTRHRYPRAGRQDGGRSIEQWRASPLAHASHLRYQIRACRATRDCDAYVLKFNGMSLGTRTSDT
jgi:hypothetical protein